MTRPYPNLRVQRGVNYYIWKSHNRSRRIPLPATGAHDFEAEYASAKALHEQSGEITRYDARRRIEPSLPRWLTELAREARKRSTRRAIEFSLSPADLVALANRADGRCEVSGLPFCHDAQPGSFYRPMAPSLDRKDPTQGYTAANTRLTCVIVNTALNQWGEGPFWQMVKAAAERGGLTATPPLGLPE